MAGNLTFRGIVFCNLGTPKQLFQILSPRGKLRPHTLPHVNMVTPTMFPVDKKCRAQKKGLGQYVLIPWYPISYLTIASYGFFWALTGPYPTLRFGGACGLGVGAF